MFVALIFLTFFSYCGADLRALCTEAALIALGRTFPDVYECTGGLVIEAGEVVVVASDFLRAMKKITPAQQRSGRTYVAGIIFFFICQCVVCAIEWCDTTLRDLTVCGSLMSSGRVEHIYARTGGK